jgi:hypothetical protein
VLPPDSSPTLDFAVSAHSYAARLCPEPFDHDDWIFELKYDAYRAVPHVENGTCWLVPRNQHVYTAFLPLCADIARLVGRDCSLGGEIVCREVAGKPQFLRSPAEARHRVFRRVRQYPRRQPRCADAAAGRKKFCPEWYGFRASAEGEVSRGTGVIYLGSIDRKTWTASSPNRRAAST